MAVAVVVVVVTGVVVVVDAACYSLDDCLSLLYPGYQPRESELIKQSEH